ncbi:MAG TPA: hypothetical protein VNA65_11970 [Candidatus Dormibacteraeota bacterium]|nr:hypothetical protein [Candidatus Dormibacteraeota bacterium]
MIEGIAAVAAWLGVSTIVLTDGRLGLASGMALTTVALTVIAWQSAGVFDAAAILIGGVVASGLRFRSGPGGWNLMPPGSTPRLVLRVGSGVLALWVAATVMQGSGTAFRFVAMIAIALPAARILATNEIAAATTATGALVLGIAVAAATHEASPGPAPYLIAALVAAGAALWPRTAPRGA